MPRTSEQRHRDALAIWTAAVDAVRSDRLVRENVEVTKQCLRIGDATIRLDTIGRIAVVGAGKAGAGMAAGLEAALGPSLMADKQLEGWVHVPEDCVVPLERIHLHAARPAGVNEPTEAGVEGSQSMMRMVAALEPDDVCIALISGGGSALLPLPIDGVTLADKLAVTRFLSAAGAPIDALNTVRRALSAIKGGGLARACGAGKLFALVISDVLGDPLDLIASGPTVQGPHNSAAALAVLEQYGAREAGISDRIFDALAQREGQSSERARCNVTNLVIGNNRLAVESAAYRAQKLGYTVVSELAAQSEGLAEHVGMRLAETALAMRRDHVTDCTISGGEPTVRLVDEARRGRGGRNQQLVLAAIERLWDEPDDAWMLLSGGTDGEDGPTDAAGAWADRSIIEAAKKLQLDPRDYLARNDAYRFFEQVDALVKTGPTHTNVCDVRVVLVERAEAVDRTPEK